MSRKQRRRKGSKPAVDIVMPVYGQPRFLSNCLDSFRRYKAGIAHTVTLVDDVSPVDMTEPYAYARSLGYKVIKKQKNGGFADSCNVGVGATHSGSILLLNTDVEIVHDGWLLAMVDELLDDQTVGVVGCLLEFFSEEHPLYESSNARPPGATQHAGVAFDIMGRPYHVFAGWDTMHPKVQTRREMNCVTGACLLTRRSLWNKIGGLDIDYGAGNFEDVQFCMTARISGRKVVYTPKARLLHFAGGSENSATAKRNARLFQFKMGQYVEYDEWRYW